MRDVLRKSDLTWSWLLLGMWRTTRRTSTIVLVVAVNKHWTRKKNPFMNETADLLTVNTNKTDLLNAFSVSVFSKKQSSSPPCLESLIRRRISSGWGADRDYVKVDDPFIKLSPRVLRNLVNVLSDISVSCHLWKVKETGEDPHLCKHYTHLQKRQKGPSRKSANQLHFGPWKKTRSKTSWKTFLDTWSWWLRKVSMYFVELLCQINLILFHNSLYICPRVRPAYRGI